VLGQFRWRQIALGGTSSDSPLIVEAGAVARAVPRLFGAVPADDAVQVRAHGRYGVDGALVVFVDGDFLTADLDHASRAFGESRDGRGISSSQAAADQPPRKVDTLPYEPDSRPKCFQGGVTLAAPP
jgi:hypothetical protein